MTTEDMQMVQNVFCNKFACGDCPLYKTEFYLGSCSEEFRPEDEPTVLRMIPLAMETTKSPDIKKYLAGFLKAEVV